ncbi:site-specific integrase [Chitinophagaceae bacterium LB-8]|uniref:Site-specific integrase n=1 Tax=Paraflavisolibacter caeni TaxID=2982496 RepID=A0A9X3BAB6_9BACT|nr:site-specific integrase [Paraflavisolibacter caeni]MCU7552486.1 site-specific integrase [Paraflavisolibacter caeni]
MIAKNFSLLFYPKKGKKIVRTEPQPLYMRITVDGIPKEISVGRKWFLDRWNTKAGRAIGTKEEVKALNAYLDTFQAKVYEARRQLVEAGREVSSEAIKNLLTGGKEKPRMLMEIFRLHNEQMKALVGGEYSAATLERYETSFKHTESFLGWKYSVQDMDIKKLDFEFVSDYEFWLKSERRCNHNSAIKYISNFRKIVNRCIRNGWLERDPFAGFKMNKREVIRDFLSEEELDRIANKRFHSERLGQVRDIFLFCCFTGLSYADVKKLKRTEISSGVDGDQWIFTSRQKTEEPSRVPLLPIALQIIEQYKDHKNCKLGNKVLPVFSNQKMNAYLKEMADVCGIHKHLTFHIARHTFATTVTLSNGVPIESVSKMLGHKNLRTTQHYAKILDRKVSEDMQLLRQRFLTKSKGIMQ